ncbi:maltose acetyltransferase domain-containing protein [Catenibacterium mitsuokai]
MTEKEKMLKEMLYNANNDEDLSKERAVAKDLCFKFNQLMPSDVENQKKLLKELLGQIDDTASILASFWCDYGYNIKVGKNFFANHNTVIIDCAPVTF